MSENYIIGDLYQGGYSSLNPNNEGELFTDYRTSAGSLGLSTDPRTANILKEVSDKLAPGEKVVELSLIQPEILEAIPKQHLKEINRLSKLTGVEITMHGPLIDASGVTQQGFDNQQREIAERKILQAIEKGHEINPKGNVPVTFHTANQLPGARYSKTEKGEEIEMMPVVNQETGQITAVKKELKHFPIMVDQEGGIIPTEKGEVLDVNRQLNIMNNSEWNNSLQQLIIPKEHADRIIAETYPLTGEIIQKIQSGEINPANLTPTQQQVFSIFKNASEQLHDIHSHLNVLFNKAYTYGPDNQKKDLKEIADGFGKAISTEKAQTDPRIQSEAIQHLMENLRKSNIRPQIYKSAEKYALEKSKETFGNAAWSSYKKFGSKSPIISIENPPAGFGLSRAEDLKNMVEGSREKFVENAKKEGMSESVAKREAEKLIGVTWDVGHINQLRQFGFTSEDIIKEAGKVAPLVKHIHLSDNFGMENVELPMGMGNVDLKEVMEKLGEKGEKAKKIIEAAHWWQHQQTSPVGATLEALGSPIYSMHMSPYWNQIAGMQEGYFGGYGSMLPPVNYETFGAGFSNLPAELGGQRTGATGGRMSGRPME